MKQKYFTVNKIYQPGKNNLLNDIGNFIQTKKSNKLEIKYVQKLGGIKELIKMGLIK